MPISTKTRLLTTAASRRNSAGSSKKPGFAKGSLEADLAAIGNSVSTGEWANVPTDYFAKLDSYLRGVPGKPPKK